MPAPAPLSGRAWLAAALAAAVFAIAVAVHAPSAGHALVWDDATIIERQLPYFDGPLDLLIPPDGIPQFGRHYYRPLSVASFLIDERVSAAIGGEEGPGRVRARVFHVSLIVMHGAAAVALLLVGAALARAAGVSRPGDLAAGLAAAVLFAAHPANAETVAWIAGRGDVLCAIFVLAATGAYLSARRAPGPLRLAALGAAAFAALLAKETGVALYLFLPLVELARPEGAEPGRDARGGPLAAWAVLLAVLAAYAGLRTAAIGTPVSPAAATDAPLASALLGGLGWYAAKVVWPFPPSVFPSELPGAGHAAAGALALAAFAAALAWTAARRCRMPLELLAAGLFFAGVAPALAVAVLRVSETPLAGRYLYLPACGATLLAAALLARASRAALAGRPRLALALPALVAGVAAVPAGLATASAAAFYESDLSLWTRAAAESPGSGAAQLNLGLAWHEEGELERAVGHYERAAELAADSEGRAQAENNLGNALSRLGRLDEAADAYRRALGLRPGYSIAHYNLGDLSFRLAASAEDREERRRLVNQALVHFGEALRLEPRYVKAHLRAGTLLVQIGRTDAGRRHLEEVVRLAPRDAREAREARELLSRLSPAP